MKKLLFLMTALLMFGITSAQSKTEKKSPAPTSKKAPKATVAKTSGKKKKEVNTAGKHDPNEKGSGMTVEPEDKPKLDDPIPDAQPAIRPQP